MNAGKPKFGIYPRWRGLRVASYAMNVATDASVSVRRRCPHQRDWDDNGHADRRGDIAGTHAHKDQATAIGNRPEVTFKLTHYQRLRSRRREVFGPVLFCLEKGRKAKRGLARVRDGAQAHPMGVIPASEIVNPWPGETVQLVPSGFAVQLNGPTPAVWS